MANATSVPLEVVLHAKIGAGSFRLRDASVDGDVFHDAARAAVTLLAEGSRNWAIPWPCVHEFYAVVTHPRIYDPPSSHGQAVEQLRSWAESPTVRFISEGADHLERLVTLCERGSVAGPKVHDARIAAICLAHGVEHLVSVDRDFSRFPRLTTNSPLT